MIYPHGILMIEPNSQKSKKPLIDNLTKKMVTAFRNSSRANEGWRGFHTCICGASSDNYDYLIDGKLTNYLCIHYLAYHREDISIEELNKVINLDYEESEPIPEELEGLFYKQHPLNDNSYDIKELYKNMTAFNSHDYKELFDDVCRCSHNQAIKSLRNKTSIYNKHTPVL